MQAKVENEEPIIAPRGINRKPPQDQYFKGALFINTLRSVVNDDARWWTARARQLQLWSSRMIHL